KLEHKSSETNASRGAGQSRVAHLGGETCWRAEHSLAAKNCRQRGHRKGDASFGEQPAQLFHRAADALLRGVFVRAERRADSSENTVWTMSSTRCVLPPRRRSATE